MHTFTETCEDICPQCGEYGTIEGSTTGTTGSRDPGDDLSFEPAPDARCAKCAEAVECARIHQTPRGWELYDLDDEVFPYVWSTREEAETFAMQELRP